MNLNRLVLVGVNGGLLFYVRWKGWFQTLQELQEKREKEILQMMKTSGGDEKFVNPLILCKAIDAAMDEDSIIVADGEALFFSCGFFFFFFYLLSVFD